MKNFDWWLALAAVLLSFMGILILFGAKQSGDTILFYKQLFFLMAGVVLMFAVSFFDYRRLKTSSSLVVMLYLAAILALGSVLIFGIKIRGSVSWFKIGNFSIEPVEFVKIVIVILFAKFFTLRHAEIYRLSHIVLSAFYAAVPVGLVLAQPDFGSAALLIALWVGMMLVAGIKRKHFLTLFIIGITAVSAMWFGVFKDYQKDRIMTFLNPLHDPYGAGYNIIQSKIAIGAGGMWGQGLGQGIQTRLGFLPEYHTDFIFSAIAEELGFVGVLLIFAGYAILSFRILKIAGHSSNNFAKLFCFGFLILIFSQFVINVGMNLGLMPVTGITLPFLSYGGSSLVSMFLALGIVQSIAIRNFKTTREEIGLLRFD